MVLPRAVPPVVQQEDRARVAASRTRHISTAFQDPPLGSCQFQMR